MGWKRYIPVVALWLAAVGGLLAWQTAYETSPGPDLLAPDMWPLDSGVMRQPRRAIVVMALHPRCPCSEASIAELARAAAGSDSRVDLVLLACVPESADREWTESATCNQAKQIPGLRMVIDSGGLIAAKLGMKTSGAVAAYDADAKLVFRGGITGARGVAGPNAGSNGLLRFVHNGGRWGDGPAQTPVFGCELVAAHCPGCKP